MRTKQFWAWARSPFTAPVPVQVREALVTLQYQRLVAALPVLCLLIAANSIAMGLAVMGDLPVWQQLAPPLIIVSTCLAVWWMTRGARRDRDAAAAMAFLRRAPLVAIPLGLVAGAWSVNAFVETERYYCMVAPVFIGIAALVTASTLNAVPRAAIGAMTATIAPIAVKMAAFDNLGVRGMAAMLILVSVMQAWFVRGKFRETVQTLVLQHELNRLAESDPLTRLDNRFAFNTALAQALASEGDVVVALADLDGFKAVNDTHGHMAGDRVLVEVAARLRAQARSAASVARLGGDEFALVYAGEDALARSESELAGLRGAIGQPMLYEGQPLDVGASFGFATTIEGGRAAEGLLRIADTLLYADKAGRRAIRLAGGRLAPHPNHAARPEDRNPGPLPTRLAVG